MLNLYSEKCILYHDNGPSDIQIVTSSKARSRQENKQKNTVYQC
jgi:hypothetical protein